MRHVRTLLSLGFALGLLPTALDGAGKPPPAPATCLDCTIVYSVRSVQAREDLMLMKEDGSQKTLLLAGAKNLRNTWPAWSPGGDWIAFARNGDGGYGVWVIRWDGTLSTKVASTCSAATRVTWSPGSGGTYWIAFGDMRGADGVCGSAGEAGDLWAVEVAPGSPVDVGERVCLTCASNATAGSWGDPAWSPDGSYLAAGLFPVDHVEPLSALYIFRLDFDSVSGAPSLVADPAWPWLVEPPAGQDKMLMPAWAHRSEALSVKATPGNDLWRLDLDLSSQTARYTDLTAESGFGIFNPRWSPDDNQFICEAAIPGLPAKSAIRVISFLPTTFTSIAPGGLHPDWKPEP